MDTDAVFLALPAESTFGGKGPQNIYKSWDGPSGNRLSIKIKNNHLKQDQFKAQLNAEDGKDDAVTVYVRPEGRPDVRKYETLACIWVEVDADTAAES